MWCYTILALIMTCLMVNIEAGRTDAQTLSLVRYPIVLGLVGQLFGISVMVPLLWIPFYIFSHGNGPLLTFCLKSLIPNILPIYILAFLAFTVPTDSYVWTVAAGILGGPIVALVLCMFWIDQSPGPTKENSIQTVNGIKKLMRYLVPFQVLS